MFFKMFCAIKRFKFDWPAHNTKCSFEADTVHCSRQFVTSKHDIVPKLILRWFTYVTVPYITRLILCIRWYGVFSYVFGSGCPQWDGRREKRQRDYRESTFGVTMTTERIIVCKYVYFNIFLLSGVNPMTPNLTIIPCLSCCQMAQGNFDYLSYETQPIYVPN